MGSPARFLAAEDDVIGEFVLVGAAVEGEMRFEGMTDVGDDACDAACIIGLVEMGKDRPYLLAPEFLAYFFMDAAVTEDSELPILQRDVDEDSVAGCGLFHMKGGKDLGGPIQGIYIAAVPLNENPDLAAGALLGGLDGRDDAFLLDIVEKRLASE